MSYSAKFMQIYMDIKKDIESEYYAPNSYLPAERKLSEKYNVQRMTIRKALDLLIEEEYIVKNPGAGSKIIFKNSTDSTYPETILYIIPEHEFTQQYQPFHWEICLQLEQLCKKDGLNLHIMKLSESDTATDFLRRIQNLKGIIWVTPIDNAFFDIAKRKNIPSIVICNDYSDFPKINLDDFGGAYTATQHLIDKGCKKIVFIKGLDSYVNTPLRLKGYSTALKSNDIVIDENLILNGDWTYDSGYSGMNQVIDSGTEFDGVVSSNDMMALGAINALHYNKIPIPSQVRVIGMDNIQNGAIATPALSTVSFSQRDITLSAFIMLKEIMRDCEVPDEILIPGKLMIRNSSE